MRKIYTSIDIGSDSIKVIVCEIFKGKLNLLACTAHKSKGIKKGVVVDADDAIISIKEAIKEVESMIGLSIKKCLVSVPSYFAEFTKSVGEVNVENVDEGVSGSDISASIKAATVGKIIGDKELVTTIPIDFTLDDTKGIKNPKGLVGSKLQLRAILVTVPKKNIYSVVSILDSMGIEVVDISINGIGDYYTYRTEATDEGITAIINVGEETTTVSLYNKGVIVKNTIVRLGGKSIENDISYMYKLKKEECRLIKEKFALAHRRYAQASEIFEIKSANDQILKINQYEVSEIIMYRLVEILEMAKKELNSLTNRKISYIIITGGVSSSAHFGYVAHEVFGKDIMIGSIKVPGIRDNKYSAAIGNILYFNEKLKLKDKEYSMFDESDENNLLLSKKGILNNESMLGKVFGYFFNE